MNVLFRIMMFISSFFPLWLSILILDLFEFNITNIKTFKDSPLKIQLTIIAMAIFIFISFVLIIFVKANSKNENTSYILKNVNKEKSITTEYLLSYILPLVSFDFAKISNLILFGIYMLLLAFLCIKNDNVYINVILEFIGYSMYSCEVSYKNSLNEEISKNIIIISKSNLVQVNNQNYGIKIFEFDGTIGINSKKEL